MGSYQDYHKLAFDKITGVDDKAGFKPGQDEATTVEQLQNYYPTRLYDDATLLQMGQLVNPTYMITEQDRAQRQARRELSERARTNLFKMVHRRLSFLADGKVPRGLDMLADFSGSPEAEEHNKRIMENFQSLNQGSSYVGGSIEERTKIMEEFIDRMDSIDYSALYTISDEKLAEEFPKLLPLYLLSVEGGDKLSALNWNEKDNPDSPHYKLSPEYEEKLGRYKKEYQGLMSYLKNRFDMIMNPSYEILHTERMVPVDDNHQPIDVYFDKSNPIGLRTQGDGDDLDADYDLETLADIVGSILQFRPYAWPDKVTNFAKTKGLDPKDIQIIRPDGEPIDAMQLEGVSMFTAIDGKSGKEYFMQSDGTNLTEVDATKALRTAKKDGDSVIQALEAADPWNLRLFAGSKEFADMKKQMKATDEAMKQLERPISEEQYKEMQDMLDDLAGKCKDYLDNKDILKEDLKETERARILAAMKTREYAENKILLLKADRELELERQARRDKNQEEMTKNLTDEERLIRAGSSTGGRRWSPEGIETVQVRQGKISDFYTGKFDEGDKMLPLGEQITSALKNPLAYQKAPEMMSKMLAYDLIMRERVSNGNEKGGRIEQQYLADPDQFCKGLEQSKTLQDIAATMVGDEGKFERFVQTAVLGRTITNEKGEKETVDLQKLTALVLTEQAQQAANSQPEMQMQAPQQQGLQNQAVEPPKLGQGSIGL